MKIRIIKILILIYSFVFLIYMSGCSEITTPQNSVPPETPKGFTLIGGGDGQAFFRWEKNNGYDTKAYRLYRSVNNINSFSLLVTLDQTEYVDRFLNYDSTYYYYLTALDYNGRESSPTEIISVQPLNISAPPPPSKLDVSGYDNPLQGAMEIKLNWIPPDIGDLKNYLVYRDTVPGFTPDPSTFIDSTNVAVYTDNLVKLNQKYFYKVIAVDKGLKRSFPSNAQGDLVLSSPFLISPGNNTRFGNPRTFQWKAVPGAVDYQVFIGNGPFSGIIWSSGKTADTEITYPGNALKSGSIYYWWVGTYSKAKVVFGDGTTEPAKINSYSQVNDFFSE